MARSYSESFSDYELRSRLEATETIVFQGRAVEWHELERQVERLGFGDLYIVSCTQGQSGTNFKVKLSPRVGHGKRLLLSF